MTTTRRKEQIVFTIYQFILEPNENVFHWLFTAAASYLLVEMYSFFISYLTFSLCQNTKHKLYVANLTHGGIDTIRQLSN